MSDDDRQLYHPDLSPEEDRRRAIADVLSEQASKVEVRRRVEKPPTTTWARVGVLVVLTLVSFYVWFGGPGWLQPDPPLPIPVEREEAGLRMAVYVQAQQVRAFRDERGRLPDILEEVGEPLPGLRYERLDSRTFRIRAFGRNGSLMYLSSDSLQLFARDADRVLGLSP